MEVQLPNYLQHAEELGDYAVPAIMTVECSWRRIFLQFIFLLRVEMERISFFPFLQVSQENKNSSFLLGLRKKN